MQIQLTINGQQHEVDVAPDQPLIHVLRDSLGLTGSKIGCGMGDCGACTVLANGVPVNACLLLAPVAQGMAITTIEGLADGDTLSPVQAAFVEQDAIQCGYCTPGMIMSAHALLQQEPDPTDDQIRHALAGNLCRCTGYHRIFAAVRAAAEKEGAK